MRKTMENDLGMTAYIALNKFSKWLYRLKIINE